ncbi:septation ring formation regulator EzrA [Vagococcus xieshaowenii]|uniref:Septation ring formation regulator EzrA n=1 Tax=Vagococcus xieshaowenii TaxID=2562451 RepID=A0AAJ5EGH6_9ENTE|nr:septation ring formation regulator EzrA [Vagococcus xieshaowenii]QCA28045.1 septation ring formation regulator EzrA [Vagococcus xieshaowenii]TFZ42099.1 septation ring formation regulator EzrA [Vagococcus xieshaowenii]
MKTSTILFVFLTIIIIIAILYVVAVLMKRKNEEKLDELEERKVALFDLPVFEEVQEVKRMHLVGQSQNTFREWNQRWADISTAAFAELESKIFEVESLNDTFRFIKVKDSLEVAFNKMDSMEQEVSMIRAGLKELKTSEERNSEAVQEALDKYEMIKESVKNAENQFGPATENIKQRVVSIENEFTQFVSLNTAGDPMEARGVLEEAEKHTKELATIVEEIPPLFEKLHTEYPAQIKEIETGYKQMKQDHYQFPEIDIDQEIAKVKEKLSEANDVLGKGELTEVASMNNVIEEQIDYLYDVLETEIKGRDYVKTNLTTVSDYVTHVEKNNRQLMIELDHTSQSYALNNNELGRARGFQTKVEELGQEMTNLNEAVKNKEVVYSHAEKNLKDSFSILKEVEGQQVEISSSLKDLRKDEKAAASKIDGYEFTLKTLKRRVDKQRLPGVPQTYLDYFFVASDRLEELTTELNRLRIDMTYINKLVALVEADLEALETKTDELINSAALTEQMLQYANRYRHSHKNVADAMERSLMLFSQEFKYQEALDEIGVALEQVEPGAFQRIESYFYKNQSEEII